MLVLSRKSNQSIMIGQDIVVTVLEIRGDHVRIGIQAPRSMPVHREELLRQIAAENRAAAGSARRPPSRPLPLPPTGS